MLKNAWFLSKKLRFFAYFVMKVCIYFGIIVEVKGKGVINL